MTYDVIVCGGGPSGVVAAISAKRSGASVLLIEGSGILGGNTTQSLVSPWMTFHDKKTQIIAGIPQEIIEELIKIGGSIGHIKDPIRFADSITPIDIEAVKTVLFDMLDKAQVDILLHAFISDVYVENSVLKAITVTTKSGKINYEAHNFIDATGDGDVAYLSKVPFQYGRESDHLTQPMSMIFHVGNVNIERIRSYVKDNPQEFHDTQVLDDDYTAASGFFSLVLKQKETGTLTIPRDRVLMFEEVRLNQVSINMTRVQGKSGVDALELSQAEVLGRKQIQEAFRFLKQFVPGFEESYILRTPSKIGVRETRHIEGLYTITKSDIMNQQTFVDAICVSAFPIDIHAPQTEGLEIDNTHHTKKYEIPLRCMIPKTIDGLIVTGRAISATHEANASLRVTPSAMALGQAAGVLAAISSKSNIAARFVDVKEVQEKLVKQGQIIKAS